MNIDFENINPCQLSRDIENQEIYSQTSLYRLFMHPLHVLEILDGPYDYRRFCCQFQSLWTIVVAVLVAASIFIPFSYFGMIYSSYNAKFTWCFTSYLVLSVLILTSVAVNVVKKVYERQINIGRFETLVDGVYIVGMALVDSLFLYFRISEGQCSRNKFEMKWHCNAMADVHRLPTLHPTLIMLISLAFIVLFRSTRWSVHILSFLTNVLLLVITTFALDANYTTSWMTIGAYFVLGGVMLYEMRRQSLYTYSIHKLLEASVQEVSTLKEREYADEMRHLIGNVAHDLKTPLAAFMGGVDQLQHITNEMSKEIPKESESILDTYPTSMLNISTIRSHLYELFKVISEVFDTNQFMLMTINRCIDHSKVTNNVALMPSITSFHLSNTINFPVDCIRRVQNNIDIMVNMDESLRGKIIMSDKIWFSENIFCLLSNAVRYSEQGTAELCITKVDEGHSCRELLQQHAMHQQLPSSNHDPFLLVELVDSGKGVEAVQISTLFAPFKQAQRRAGGTGLGLFAMACRMRALGGYYGVRNRVDSPGAIFWFAIPFKEDESGYFSTPKVEDGDVDAVVTSPSLQIQVDNIKASSCPTTVDTNTLASLTPHTSMDIPSLFILVVDDTMPIQKVLTNVLQRKGHHVDIVDNGLKAARALGALPSPDDIKHAKSSPDQEHQQQWKEKVYDVVLMDLQMPVMDGFEAIHHIRHHEATRHQPHQYVIAMSANSDELTVNEALKAGADAFMMKPFQVDSFHKLYAEHKLRSTEKEDHTHIFIG